MNCDSPEKIHEIVKDLERETMYGYPWNKAYNLKFLKESCVHFKKITHVEDILFNIQIFMEAKHVVVLPNVLITIVIRTGKTYIEISSNTLIYRNVDFRPLSTSRELELTG